MANALKTLFTDIATSIRGGLPDEGAMSPYSFPEKIDEIVASLGTGGSGGSSGGSASGFIIYACNMNFSYTNTNYFKGGGDTISSNITVTIPEDAVLVGFRFRHRAKAFASDGNTLLGYTDWLDVYIDPNKMSETLLSDGGKKVTLGSFTFSYDGAAYITVEADTGNEEAYVILPNVSIVDNILYAGPDCKGIIMNENGTISRECPYYVEEIDLRGSQITTLGKTLFNTINELKKVYLSEGLTKIGSYTFADCPGLTEVHFTSETPPTIDNYSFRNLPTTCKIYVPSGTLDAYTSASNYPSASTYTYIEE